MKIPLRFLFGAAFLGLGGCGAPQQPLASAPTLVASKPTPSPKQVAVATSAPLKIVQSGRSSLPGGPEMMADSPRPTFIPLPTPTPQPAPKTLPTPAPRENSTIVVSNAPVPGTNLTPQAAAARELVWVNSASGIFHRPGSRFYGGTTDGFYMTETQAIGRGYRAALR